MTRAEVIEILKAYPLVIKDQQAIQEAIEMAISSLEIDEAYQLEYERPGECKAEDITEEQVVTYLHYHGMMAVSKELWHAMYDEMIKNGVTVEEQQGENT